MLKIHRVSKQIGSIFGSNMFFIASVKRFHGPRLRTLSMLLHIAIL